MVTVYDAAGNYLDSNKVTFTTHTHTSACYQVVHCKAAKKTNIQSGVDCELRGTGFCVEDGMADSRMRCENGHITHLIDNSALFGNDSICGAIIGNQLVCGK